MVANCETFGCNDLGLAHHSCVLQCTSGGWRQHLYLRSYELWHCGTRHSL